MTEHRKHRNSLKVCLFSICLYQSSVLSPNADRASNFRNETVRELDTVDISSSLAKGYDPDTVSAPLADRDQISGVRRSDIWWITRFASLYADFIGLIKTSLCMEGVGTVCREKVSCGGQGHFSALI